MINRSTNQPLTPPIPERAFLVLGGMIFPIEKEVFTIGRNLENDLVLNDPTVSRFHAEIHYTDHQFILVDKNSSSGTFLNSQQVTRGLLFAGDIILVAKTPILFMNQGASIIDKARRHTGQLRLFSESDIEEGSE